MPTRKRSPVPMSLSRVDDAGSEKNFRELNRVIAEFHPQVSARETGSVTLVTGVNRVRPPIKNPSGRQVIWQNAHATIVDVNETVDENGDWLVDSSAPCTVKFLFY